MTTVERYKPLFKGERYGVFSFVSYSKQGGGFVLKSLEYPHLQIPVNDLTEGMSQAKDMVRKYIDDLVSDGRFEAYPEQAITVDKELLDSNGGANITIITALIADLPDISGTAADKTISYLPNYFFDTLERRSSKPLTIKEKERAVARALAYYHVNVVTKVSNSL